MERIAFTMAVAFIGGFIGYQLKIPAGALVGAMLFVGVANVIGLETQIPKSYSVVAEIVIGAFLGLSINKEVITGLKDYIIPSIMVVALLALFGIVTGFIVNKVTGIDLLTSLFGSVPGGMQEMVVLSQSYDVNHPAVVVIQTVRRVLIVVIYPALVFFVTRFGTNIHTQFLGK